jgi:hypothetical protein
MLSFAISIFGMPAPLLFDALFYYNPETFDFTDNGVPLAKSSLFFETADEDSTALDVSL